MSFSAEERETVIISNDACDYWQIFTRQRKVATKVKKIPQVEIINEVFTDSGTIAEGTYRLPFKCVKFGALRALSPEAAKVAVERLEKVRRGKTPADQR